MAFSNLTRDFVHLLLGWPADGEALQERCRLLMVDGIAVAVAGAAERGPSLAADLARAEYAGGACTVIAQSVQMPAAVAARINGVAMHVLDYEPMWNPPNHAISPLLPALLALAEQREAVDGVPRGQAVLRALAKGIEAQGRLRLSSGQFEPAQLSMHPPGVVGAIASAIACADLLGLDDGRATMAAGIAASRTSGVLANVGSHTKALHCGDAAANGLEAAQLAERGFTANDDALNGPRGWGAAFFGDRFDPQALLDPIGDGRALVPGPSWKLFPSQFGTHFGITAALDARARIDALRVEDIRRITLRAPPMPYIDRPSPATGLEGKFSWQYTATLALLDGKVEPASFTDACRRRPEVEALLRRFELISDAGIVGKFDEMHVELTVHRVDASAVVARCDTPRGSWRRPVAADVITEKAEGLLEAHVGAARTRDILQAAAQPAHAFSILALMRTLGQQGSRQA
jgi:aconitate decarboxylase